MRELSELLQTLEASVKVAMLGACLSEGVKIKDNVEVRIITIQNSFRLNINIKAWDNQCYGFYLDYKDLMEYQVNISVILREALMPFVLSLKENQLILKLSGVE